MNGEVVTHSTYQEVMAWLDEASPAAISAQPAEAAPIAPELNHLNWRKGISRVMTVVALTGMFSFMGRSSDLPEASARQLEAMLSDDEGLNGNNQEEDYHIAEEGSCSPYDFQDAINAKLGILKIEKDLNDVEADFLKQNPGIAKNFAMSGESRIHSLYDALGIDRPSENKAEADERIIEVYEDDYYVTGKLKNAVTVQNTFCDEKGNVHNYRVVTLEAGSYVGGMIIDKQFTKDGKLYTKFKNGRSVVLQDDALIVTIVDANGKDVRMYATNKAGFSADDDYPAEVGCENIITKPPKPRKPKPTPTPTPSETPTPKKTPRDLPKGDQGVSDEDGETNEEEQNKDQTGDKDDIGYDDEDEQPAGTEPTATPSPTPTAEPSIKPDDPQGSGTPPKP